jgi:SAM-dependent methyltransferase
VPDPRIAALSSAIERNSRFGGPVLWNDTGGALAEPTGRPADMVSDGASVDAALARFASDPVLQRVAGWPRERVMRHARADTQPIPATADRVGYYGSDDIAYWLSGIGEYLLVSEIAQSIGRPLAGRFLDFGAATGRVLRHFADLAPEVEAIGIDLSRQHVAWTREHLFAPVLQGTALPSLPFADSSIDVIYAGSVFTHINDFEEAWLAELRRVMAPSGFALVTIHTERGWDEMRANARHPLRRRVLDTRHRLHPGGIDPVTDAIFGGEMPSGRIVFEAVDWPETDTLHSHAWIRERWGRQLQVARIMERSHGIQDCVILTPLG